MIIIHQIVIFFTGIFFLFFFEIIKLNTTIFLFFKKKFQNKIYFKFPYIYRDTCIYIPLLSLIDKRGIGRFSKNIFLRTYNLKNQFNWFYPSKKVFLYPSIHHINPNFDVNKSLVFILDIIPLQHPKKYDAMVLNNWKTEFTRIINSANNLYTISLSSKSVINSFFDRRDVKLIYPGADHFIFQFNFFKKYILPDQEYLVFLGSTSVNKNIEIILDNFEFINNSISIVIIGNSTNLTKTYNNSRIIFTGYLLDQSKDYLIKNSLLMLCPSINEGFGFAQFEAAKFKKPSLMSNIKVFKELWRDCGFFCSPFSSTDWIKMINYLLQNRKLIEEFGLKAHKNYKKFTWKKTISIINREIDNLN